MHKMTYLFKNGILSIVQTHLINENLFATEYIVA